MPSERRRPDLEQLAKSRGKHWHGRCEAEGMRAYSTDLKERLVRAVAAGQPMREAARRFEVAVTTVKRAVVQQRETGSLERRPIPGRPRAIRGEQETILRARLEAAPDATVLEHCAWWAGAARGSSSVRRRCGGRCVAWAGRIKKDTGSERARRGGAYGLARGGGPDGSRSSSSLSTRAARTPP